MIRNTYRFGIPYHIAEQLLLYSSIVMAGSAVGWSLFATKLLHLQVDLSVFILIFAMAVIMYNRDRLADRRHVDDQINMKARSHWIETNQKALYKMVVASIVAAIAVLIFHSMALIPILGGIGFALVYSTPILPQGKTLKQLPGLKIPYVAILWTVLVVGVPMAVSGSNWHSQTARVIGTILCFTAALVNLNDIRDIAGDRLVGTQTLAVMWGEKIAKAISLLLVGLGTIATIPLHSWGIIAKAIYLVVLIVSYHSQSDRHYRWFIEGAGIIGGLLILGLG